MNVLVAFLLTLIAGLSTGIGSLVAFFTKTSNKKFLAVSLGFSAGVMIYVSMIEIFFKARDALALDFSEKTATLFTIVGFFGGMLLIGLIDKLIPKEHNPHEVADPNLMAVSIDSNEAMQKEPLGQSTTHETKLMRTGLFTALAISIHNFPEGLATFISALQEPSLAIPIVVAIAIHNIPEGIAVAVPIYYATKNRKKAFFYSFASGLSEPVGALIGYLILLPFMSNAVYGVLFAMVAGIMVFISFDELLPSARAYGEHHLSVYGLVAGMAVMAISLWLFM